jgi:serine/threonine protein kinase/Tol biopolymer transport system component
MALNPGTRFGSHEITDRIGAGGMGEVYLAHDTTLERDVAIKVLPESFASDESRIARFEQEAKTLASLNHTNIAQVFGLERADGQTAIVMELIEGPTLADRIEQGPLPADEALNIAMQIADALEAAHEQNIIHRDLKPANIKLKPDGTVKVLDFGIAKALAPEHSSGSQSPIMTTPVTQVGVILGTAAYMSPEQARGKPVDKRADIWAFGCVLYEMLTGQLAFGGEDVAVILARVIANDTDLDSLPAAISPAVQRTLELCLQKDPRKRVRDIGDVKLALAGEFETIGAPPEAAARASTSLRQWLWPGIAAVLAIAAGLGAIAALRPPPALVETRLHTLAPFVMSPSDDFSLSPDGRYIVVGSSVADASGMQLSLWDLATMQVEQLPGTTGAERPFWSPDSRFVGFTAAEALRQVDTRGGPAQTILVRGARRSGGFWGPDDTIVFGNAENGFSRVPVGGGEPVVVTRAQDSLHHELPAPLPDGRHFIYFNHATNSENAGIYIAAIDTTPDNQPTTPLIRADDGVEFVPDGESDQGYILFQREGNLLAQRFDTAALELTGDAVPVAAGVRGGNGNGFVATSADGALLIYRPGTSSAGVQGLVWVDVDGNETRIEAPQRDYRAPRVSPDGRRLAIEIDDDIWIWDDERGTLTRLTFEDGFEIAPVWSGDGQRILYYGGDEPGIYSKTSDGTNEPERLIADLQAAPVAIAEGDSLIYVAASGNEIGATSIDGSAEPETLIGGQFREIFPALSPDGRWLAYQSDESGVPQIYVRPYPDVTTGRWQVSTANGIEPKWAPDGRAIYYRTIESTMMAANVEAGDRFVAGMPRSLFDVSSYAFFGRGPYGRYDVAPDGRFVFMSPGSEERADSQLPQGDLVFVQNWLAGVKAREARD